jgi:hypothetical protein
MRGFLLFLTLATTAIFAEYKLEKAAALPADLDPAIAKMLNTEGSRLTDAAGKPIVEIFLRSTAPTGAKSTEDAVSLPTLVHGALVGVMHFPARWNDRRGQTIKPGLYTMRYSMYPINGDHQGAAPQRDFFVLTPIAEDKDPNATPNFDTLMNMSRKASGTPHPAVFSVWKAEPFKPGLAAEGEDWSISMKLGDVPVAIILVGKVEA